MTDKNKSIIVSKLEKKISGKKLSGSFNKSYVFLLPMLDFSTKFIDDNIKNLINIYYHCEEDVGYDNNYKDRIYCVFKKDKIDPTKAAALYNTQQFIGTIEKDNYLIFIFKVPEIYLQDYLLFKKGMFSKMSAQYKAQVITMYPSDVEYLRGILDPSDKDKQQLSIFLGVRDQIKEVYSVPEPSEEIFKMSNFYKLII